MPSPTTVSQFINTLQQERAKWNTMIDSIDREDMLSLGVVGEWSLKDLIAHITWFERQMVELVQAHALVGSELWNLPTDERNAAIYADVRGQSLEQVLAESTQVHQQLLELLPTLSDEDLTNAGNFPHMPPDWQPWLIIAQNTYEHYQQHMPDIQNWITKTQLQ